MTELEIVGLDEAAGELEAPQAGDTYVAKRDVSIEGDLAITGTVDGRDIAADGVVLDTAVVAGGTVPLTANWNVGAFKITALNLGVTNYLDFTPMTGAAYAEGRVFYDDTEKALSYFNEESDVTMNLGQEMWLRVYNDSGVLIENGKVVSITGSDGTNPEITKVIATSNTTRVLGISTHSIENGTYGYVTTYGIVRGIDTSGFSAGAPVYLSRATAGELEPTASTIVNESLQVGLCITSHASTGTVLVDVENSQTLFPVSKSYNYSARNAASGEYFLGGFYNYAAAEAALTNASATQVFGDANNSSAAHAFMVFGAGSTNGTTITITVTGTSITDAGVRTPADSEIIFTGDPATLTLDDYLETSLKWLGQVTYTLTSDGGTFACDLNYGMCKYDDFQNVNHTIRALEVVGLCDATDTGFNIELLHHTSSGWTFSAGAFVAGNTPLKSMNTIHSTEQNITAGEGFAFKASTINHAVAGASSDGFLIRITTSVNNSVAYLNAHVDATIP